jgi:HEAT repeat protein
MTRCIYKKVFVAFKILLIGCSLPLLLSSTALSQEQNCTQAQIQANISKFKDTNQSVSQAAVHAVVKCQSESIKPLIEALNDQSDEVRENTAKALMEIGSAEEAVPQLILSLQQDKSFAVRMYVALAFAAMGESAKEAVPQLILSLQQDPDSGVRSAIASTLRVLGVATQ